MNNNMNNNSIKVIILMLTIITPHTYCNNTCIIIVRITLIIIYTHPFVCFQIKILFVLSGQFKVL